MAKQNKQAKFYCEYCDSEVPAKAKFCPKCGHFFLSVRCPACGKTGSHEEFENGCPQCGYAFSGSPEEFKKSKKNNTVSPLNTLKNGQRTGRGYSQDYSDYSSPRKMKSDDALPLWVYLMTFTVFAGIVVFIITQCRT